jgi:hypothetical protein
MRWLLLSGVMAVSIASADPPAVIEVVDLTCPHCAEFAPRAEEIAARVRGVGGVFRVAPVSPAAQNLPSPAVLAVYVAQEMRGDAYAQRVAASLMRGYAAQAALDTQDAVRSWLALDGLDLSEDGALWVDARSRWMRALGLVKESGLMTVPMVLIYRMPGARLDAAFAWRDGADDLSRRIDEALRGLSDKGESK